MKRLIPTLLVAVVAAAPAQVITTVKSYPENVTPTPPGHLIRGEDGTLYGLGNMLYRWQPDESGLAVLTQEGFGGPLSLSGDTLYGMDTTFKAGTLFKIRTAGTGFAVLRHLQDQRPGDPSGSGLHSLALSGCTLYGPSPFGGEHKAGAIYSVNLLPDLSIARAGAGFVEVFWPTMSANVVLQKSTGSPGPWNWADVTDSIEDDGTTSRARFPITPGSRFFRLLHH